MSNGPQILSSIVKFFRKNTTIMLSSHIIEINNVPTGTIYMKSRSTAFWPNHIVLLCALSVCTLHTLDTLDTLFHITHHYNNIPENMRINFRSHNVLWNGPRIIPFGLGFRSVRRTCIYSIYFLYKRTDGTHVRLHPVWLTVGRNDKKAV